MLGAVKIIRFLDSAGNEGLGRQHDNGSVTRLTGEIYGQLSDSGESVEVSKLLSPIVPTDILCIGLNYARHAAEGGMDPPADPVLFMKNCGAVQNPIDPIVLPRTLASDKVDFECDLAVVIGKT